FSSRRRHTRFSRDWSSDVCSSDLLYDAMFPDSAQWDHHAMLLAAIIDSLNIQVWQGGNRRRADFPRPIPRPGVEDKHERKFGGKPVEIEDMQKFLERKRAGGTTAAA